jgi:hypothetical protein
MNRATFLGDLTRAEAVDAIKRGEKTIGTRTLGDIPWSEPDPPLLAPYIVAEGVTILYGPGGVGKGMLSVYWAKRLTQLGLTVMVLDFENHETEWAHRSRQMGFTEEQLSRVHYRAPFSGEWTAPSGSLADVAQFVRMDCEDRNVDCLIIDSYAAATSTGDALGGKEPADEFFAAIRHIDRPALVIAHVAGSSQRFPDKPFGSVFVRNYARTTWAVESGPDLPDIPFDPDTNRLQPTVMTLELRQTKLNVGSKSPPQFIAFSFFADLHIEVDEQAPQKQRQNTDLIDEVLGRDPKALTVNEIQKVIKTDYDRVIVTNTLEKALRQHPTRFSRVESSRPYRWKRADKAE